MWQKKNSITTVSDFTSTLVCAPLSRAIYENTLWLKVSSFTLFACVKTANVSYFFSFLFFASIYYKEPSARQERQGGTRSGNCGFKEEKIEEEKKKHEYMYEKIK